MNDCPGAGTTAYRWYVMYEMQVPTFECDYCHMRFQSSEMVWNNGGFLPKHGEAS